ncbi:MAG TPA: glycosyltransferase, partial [Gemmatimonadaceae bacterium]|nr:glycosyltransferase [Gemmatimonadaceae bacterium]
LPSHHENFGVVVIEAIAAGLPVVVSRHVQLRDFVAEHDLGVVSGDSPDSLAQCLKSALADKALQSRARSLGKNIVSETFSAEVIGKRLSAMYLAAVNSHRDRLSGN